MTPTSFIEQSHPDFQQEQREARQERSKLEGDLVAIAHEIENYRIARRPQPSQNGWVVEWPGLGSQKTYSNILAGKLANISVEAQLPKYRAVGALLSTEVTQRAKEELYEDVAGGETCTLQALRLLHHQGKNCFMEIKGGNGSGKTSSLQIIQAKVGTASMKIVEANDTWKSDKEFLQDVLLCLGFKDENLSSLKTNGDRLKKLLEIVPRGKFILGIDEFHHCTGRILNLIKTLINRTGLRIIAAGINTLMQKLKASAAEEAKQLFQNRLFCSITLAGPDEDGASRFFCRRLATGANWKKSTLKAICDAATHRGAWSFVRRIVEHLQNGGITDPNNEDMMSAALSAEAEVA